MADAWWTGSWGKEHKSLVGGRSVAVGMGGMVGTWLT